MTSRRALFLILGFVLLACALPPTAIALACAWTVGPPAPTDQVLRERVREDRAAFEALCGRVQAMPPRVVAVGRDEGRVRFATDRQWHFEPPTTAMLEEAGMPPRDYDGLIEDLEELDVMIAERQSSGVHLTVHMAGIVPSGSSTYIVCADEPPAPVVSQSDAMQGGHGEQCALLLPGFHACRIWN